MHYRMLVTISKAAAADSEEARKSVFEALINDNSFCGEGGRFGASLADWFVIGGRWSGLLAETVMAGAFTHAVRARFPDMDREWLPHSVIDTHATDLDAIWQSLGGDGPSPYSRSSYEEYGYPDDAMLLTQPLYTLLTEYEGASATRDGYADLDGDELHPSFVGRKWLVVVDYHN